MKGEVIGVSVALITTAFMIFVTKSQYYNTDNYLLLILLAFFLSSVGYGVSKLAKALFSQKRQGKTDKYAKERLFQMTNL